MATYQTFEITTRRVVFAVPSPSPLAELGKAIQAARLACAKAKGRAVDELYDTDVMVASVDDQVYVYFEVEEKP